MGNEENRKKPGINLNWGKPGKSRDKKKFQENFYIL